MHQRAVFGLSECFLKTLKAFAHFMMGEIHECTCPHLKESSAIFDQKPYYPHAPPSLVTQYCPK